MSSIQESLSNIQAMLSTVVDGGSGRAGTRKMRAPEFVAYAHAEVAKAMKEPSAQSTRRLKALHAAVQVFKDNYTSDEAINVPVYENDVTAMDDKSTALTTPAAAAGTNPDGQTAFEQGFVAKFNSLREQVNALLKALPEGDGDEDEDEEKRKAKAAAAATGEEEPEEPEEVEADKRKAAATAPDPEDDDADKRKAAAKVRKGVDVAADGTKWPSDLNDPAFLKDGQVAKNIDWGADPA